MIPLSSLLFCIKGACMNGKQGQQARKNKTIFVLKVLKVKSSKLTSGSRAFTRKAREKGLNVEPIQLTSRKNLRMRMGLQLRTA